MKTFRAILELILTLAFFAALVAFVLWLKRRENG
jgi:hypothetical protein